MKHYSFQYKRFRTAVSDLNTAYADFCKENSQNQAIFYHAKKLKKHLPDKSVLKQNV